MKISLTHIAIGILTISIMTFLFFKTTIIDANEHSRFTKNLREIKELDTTLDKDILELRYGLTNSYDLLTTETDQIKKLEGKLNEIPSFVDGYEREEINNILKTFHNLEAQKLAFIESFKSRNATINNSLRYFPVASARVTVNLAADSSTRNVSDSLNNLARETLIFYLLPNTNLDSQINKRIAWLKEYNDKQPVSENKTDLDISLAHAQSIFELKPEVDGLIKDAVALETSEKIDEIIKIYYSQYDQSLNAANFYRLLLYIFSVLMLAYIAYIIIKLKKASSELNSVNESLEQRVEERTEALSLSHSELQKSETNNTALLHAIPDSMWRMDNKGVFLDIITAKGEEEIMPKEQWLGKTIFEVLAKDVAEKIIELAKISLTTGETQLLEYKLERNEQIYHYESRIAVCGKSEILTIVRDISERKLLEEQLHRAQKLESIGQLAAGIAHEINTPTQYVGDNTRFLKDSFDDLADVLSKNAKLLEACREQGFKSEFVTQLEEAIEFADTDYLMEEIPKAIGQALVGVDRIGKIVQSMKDFAHPGSADKQATDLNRAIESTITVASNEWKYIAEMVTDFDRSLPAVPCLIGEFNQVILNMIVNAAHAIADVVGDGNGGKGIITIATKLKDDWAEISISDSGTGIKEEVRKKIFDPFFTTKEVGKGTGQGLAISHSVITEKHKGKIVVESELGKGTKFIISLPLKEEIKPDQELALA